MEKEMGDPRVASEEKIRVTRRKATCGQQSVVTLIEKERGTTR